MPGRKSHRKSLIIKFSEVSGLCHSVATIANLGGIDGSEESEEEVEEKMEPMKGATKVPYMVAAIEGAVERAACFGSVFVDSFLPRPFEAEAEAVTVTEEVEVDAFFNSGAGAGTEERGFKIGGYLT